MRDRIFPLAQRPILAAIAALGLALLPQPMMAQIPTTAETVWADTSDAAEIDQASFIQLLELDNSDRMTVPVSINNHRTVPFIVDTGSERTVISNELGRYLALAAGPILKLATVSGPAQVRSFRIDSLKTLAIEVNGVEAPGLAQRNLGAFGLLGIDSLENHKVLLDFRNKTMQVLPSARTRGRTSVEQGMIIVTATRRAGRMILSSAEIGGERVDIILDTGTQSSIGNSALRRRLRSADRSMGYSPIQLKTVTGELIIAEFTQISEIKIGGFAMNNLPITFANDYVFDSLQLSRRPAILLGMDALRIFDRVVIDFGNRKVGFDLPRNIR
jgi:predicted aspartyl protease